MRLLTTGTVGLLVALAGAGCASRLTPLTNYSMSNYRLAGSGTANQVATMQLVVSRDISLQVHTRSSGHDVQRARLTDTNNEKFNDVLLVKKGTLGTVPPTKCQAISTDPTLLPVCFGTNTSTFLNFKLGGNPGENRFVLVVNQVDGKPTVEVGESRTVYEIINGEGACLLYDQRECSKITNAVHLYQGRRFNNYQ